MSEEHGQENDQQLFPEPVRTIWMWLSLIFSILIILYLVCFALGRATANPSDLGLPNLLLFSLACLLLFSVPWHKMGLALRKFGPLEFEKKLEGQSEENISLISSLEEKIESLETKMQSINSKGVTSSNPVDIQQEEKLKNLIVEFLSNFNRWSFSPSRMEKWGAEQPGFSGLRGQPELFRRTLRKLVAEEVLETTISKKGNTLYRIRS